VIPTRDRRDLLPTAIISVLNQDKVVPELLVVDDGSVDGTADVIDAIDDPRVRLISHDSSKGIAAALNT
jgi:glycosyltransferase involved in cell wall biosynthesis